MGPPDVSFVRESLYYDVPDVIGMMTKVVQAWKSVCLEGGKYFGKKIPRPMLLIFSGLRREIAFVSGLPL